MANAWHLRNDGKAFPVQVHLYPMQDPDLSSEAEVAMFMVKTNSKDTELAKYTLDAFMVMLISREKMSSLQNEDTIEAAIESKLSSLPFKFAYPLNTKEMIDIHRSQKNFFDVNSTVDFINEVDNTLEKIQQDIKNSFNQQFCRVRIGGQFNSVAGNTCVWFRIASVGYNWDNVIYVFASDLRRKYGASYITICRDAESDGSEEEYFYKARDGVVYHMMPIDEFFTEEHEKNPVFSATEVGSGVIRSIRKELQKGNTFFGAYNILASAGINCDRDYRPYLYRQELESYWISASQWYEELQTRTRMKISKMKQTIRQRFPEILDMDVDYASRENSKGNPVGFELLCKLVSNHPKLNDLEISIVSTKSLASTTAESLARLFTMEYRDYLKYAKITI